MEKTEASWEELYAELHEMYGELARDTARLMKAARAAEASLRANGFYTTAGELSDALKAFDSDE